MFVFDFNSQEFPESELERVNSLLSLLEDEADLPFGLSLRVFDDILGWHFEDNEDLNYLEGRLSSRIAILFPNYEAPESSLILNIAWGEIALGSYGFTIYENTAYLCTREVAHDFLLDFPWVWNPEIASWCLTPSWPQLIKLIQALSKTMATIPKICLPWAGQFLANALEAEYQDGGEIAKKYHQLLEFVGDGYSGKFKKLFDSPVVDFNSQNLRNYISELPIIIDDCDYFLPMGSAYMNFVKIKNSLRTLGWTISECEHLRDFLDEYEADAHIAGSVLPIPAHFSENQVTYFGGLNLYTCISDNDVSLLEEVCIASGMNMSLDEGDYSFEGTNNLSAVRIHFPE